MRHRTLAMLTAALFAVSPVIIANAGELKVNGSGTVAQGVVIPNKAAIEQASGLTLTVTPNGSGNGLKDLSAGKADVAMISAPLQSEAETANKASPGSVDAAAMTENAIGVVTTKIIVNAANPVKALTPDQIKAIFSGKVTSWKDVGGPDRPILLVVEAPGGGGRAVVVSQLLEGTDIAASARVVQAIGQIAQIVAQAPNAIGYAPSSSVTGSIVAIPGAEVKQPLAIVTKGAPSADAKRFIEAAAKFAPK